MKPFVVSRMAYVGICAALIAIVLVPYSPIFTYSGFLYSPFGKLMIVAAGILLVGVGGVLTLMSFRRGERPYAVVVATLIAAYVAVTALQWYVLR